MSLSVRFWLAAFALISCHPNVAPSDAAPPVVSAQPSGSPLSRLAPKPDPGSRAGRPMTLVPGVSFGPIALGETLDDLKHGGLVVSNVTDSHADVGVANGNVTMRVSLCGGKIVDIWIDDLRLTPSITYEGKTLAPSTPREELEKTFGGCTAMPARIGGAFEKCHDGGLYVGHGMGDFIQLRVRPKAFPFDDECSFASDDGSIVELSPKERSSLLKQTLDLAELSKFWHVDRPGRDPLRIVKTPLAPERPLAMFGAPVTWIDEKDATKGSAYFVLTKLSATKTKATVAFGYPIEGIVGTAVFARSAPADEWRLERANVAEK